MKKIMKKTMALLLAMVLAFALAACGEKVDAKAEAEKTVKGAIEALKKLDMEEAAKYIVTEEDEDLTSDLEAEAEAFMNPYLSKLNYEIVSSEEKDDKVEVTVKLTSVKMDPVMEDFVADLMTWAMSAALEEEPSEEEITQQMTDMFEASMEEKGTETEETEIVVEVEKVEDAWKINNDGGEKLVEDMFAGLLEGMEAMGTMFTE